MAHTLAFHLIRISRQLQNAIGFKSDTMDLSPSEASALLIIDSQKDTSQIEIALKLHLKAASVVSLIDELEELGLVMRMPYKNDRRKYQIRLTDKGKVQVKDIREQSEKLEDYVKKTLSKDEVKILFLALEKISNSLENYSETINSLNLVGEEVKREIPGAKRQMAP